MRGLIIILVATCAHFGLWAQVDNIITIAGKDSAGFSGDGGPSIGAKLNTPEYLNLDRSGNVYIADGFNHRIRKITAASGIIQTVVGTGVPNYNGDNIPDTQADLFVPCAICTDSAENIYVADAGNNRIRRIDAVTGLITTVAGSGPTGIGLGGSSGDGGLATRAKLDVPVGLCIDKYGNIYIGDYSNNKVRRVDAATGIITTFAGQQGPVGYTGGLVGYSGDGGLATNAVLSGPIQVYADSIGNVFICDQWNHAVRKVDITTQIISTIAGNGTAGHSGDGGLAIHAQLNQPAGIDMDKKGNLFIAEYGSGVIRRIDAVTGIISTVAGNDTLGFSGDGGNATNAEMRCSDVRVDDFGTIYVADLDNNRIRKVYNPKLAIPMNTPHLASIRIFPNPATEMILVSYLFADERDGEIVITDMMGRTMEHRSLYSQNREEEVDVSMYSPGLYLYRIVQGTTVLSIGKLIKQ